MNTNTKLNQHYVLKISHTFKNESQFRTKQVIREAENIFRFLVCFFALGNLPSLYVFKYSFETLYWLEVYNYRNVALFGRKKLQYGPYFLASLD